MIVLQQAFYGRDPIRGYCLLASSDSRFDSDVEALCVAVGTPDGTSTFSTFHINAIRGDYRYLIAVSPVQSSPGGRQELFFHVYIGRQRDLLAQRFGLADLLQTQAFESRYAGTSPRERAFSGGGASFPVTAAPFVWKRENFAVVSRRPQLELMANLLRDQVDLVSWASFSFCPLNAFKAYVLSEFAPKTPGDRVVRNERGEVLRPASLPKAAPSPRTESEVVAPVGQASSIWRTLFFLSLLVNVAAVCRIGFGWGQAKQVHAAPAKVEQVQTNRTDEISPEKKEEIREEVLDELRREFDRLKTTKTVTDTDSPKFKAYLELYNCHIRKKENSL